MPDIFEQQERELLAVVNAARAILDEDGELKPWGLLEDAIANLDGRRC